MNDPRHDQPPAIPDHELIRCVGRGSYGEVWLARNVMGTFRAVKIVYRDRFDSDRPYDREFNGMNKFEPVSRTHAGLVNLLHIGRNAEAGYFYCVMEVADDVASGQAIDPESYRPRTLASEIAKHGRWPARECVELGISLASALGHLHSRGLVHRDIKPSNIIFIAGMPKFADIGLVTQIGTKATFVGTEGFLAPEGPGSPAADIYSLGRVLYEISMGKSQDQFPELPTRLRELPDAPDLMRLNAVVLRACEHQAAKRFRSAEELGVALSGLTTARAGREPGLSANGLKLVILFRGEVVADANLAKDLAGRLAADGYAVSVDDQRELNVPWARRIEQEIRAAHAVIPLLSADSMRSETMAYSLEVASQASRRPGGLPRLLPVHVGPCDAVPRQFAVALEGIQPVLTSETVAASEAISAALRKTPVQRP